MVDAKSYASGAVLIRYQVKQDKMNMTQDSEEGRFIAPLG